VTSTDIGGGKREEAEETLKYIFRRTAQYNGRSITHKCVFAQVNTRIIPSTHLAVTSMDCWYCADTGGQVVCWLVRLVEMRDEYM